MCGRAVGGAPSARSRIHHDVLQTIRGNTCAERQRVGSGSGRQYGAGRAGNGGREQTPPVMDIMAVAEQSGRWGGERRDIDPLHSCRAAPSMRTGLRPAGAPGAEAEATCVEQHVQHVAGTCLDQHVGMTWRAERSSRWLRPGSVGLRGRRYVTLGHPTRAGHVRAPCGRRCIRRPTTSARAP